MGIAGTWAIRILVLPSTAVRVEFFSSPISLMCVGETESVKDCVRVCVCVCAQRWYHTVRFENEQRQSLAHLKKIAARRGKDLPRKWRVLARIIRVWHTESRGSQMGVCLCPCV